MKTIKRVSTDYDIHSATVTVYGNLVVVGTTTSVESVDTLVYDNFITLGAGQTGTPTQDVGLDVERGDELNVGIRWNESAKNWEYTNDGVIWKSFSRTIVQEDPDPHLGGNLVVNDFQITSEPGKNVVIYAGEGGDVRLGPIVRLPQFTANANINSVENYSTIFAKPNGAGETGFYASSKDGQGRELITKRKSLIYSIIF